VFVSVKSDICTNVVGTCKNNFFAYIMGMHMLYRYFIFVKNITREMYIVVQLIDTCTGFSELKKY
jgi:hypothetical protein